MAVPIKTGVVCSRAAVDQEAVQRHEDELFRAFMAGFDVSGEGWNGEYVGSRYREPGVLEGELREDFKRWREKGA